MFRNDITFQVNHLEIPDVSEKIDFGINFNHIFVVDFSCKGTKSLLQKVVLFLWVFFFFNLNLLTFLSQANKELLFREPNHWLLLHDSENNNDNVLEHLDMFVDSKVVVIEKTTDPTSFVLNYVYKVRKHSELITDTFGKWNTSKKGFDFLRNGDSLTRRRRNLQRHQLKVSVVIMDNSSYGHLTDYR